MRKQRGMTQAQVAEAMGVSQVRVSRMEHGDVEKMQVESIAAYVAAIGGHLRVVACFGHTPTTLLRYTRPLTPRNSRAGRARPAPPHACRLRRQAYGRTLLP